MDNRIGAQYFTLRDFCKTLEDFDATCKKVSEIGYKLVQLSGIGNFEAKDIKAVLDKYGLEVICTHRMPNYYRDNLDKEIEFHKTIGAKICGIGCMPGFKSEPEDLKKFIEDFKPIVKKLEENDLIFGYHNHEIEFTKIDGKYIFDIINEGIDSDNFKWILDVYWLAVAGIDPAKFIRKHSDRIACLHYKDLKIEKRERKMAEVGMGNLDWDDIIAASMESGALCALVEQDVCETDPFDCLKTSYDFLTKKGFE
ncbi:MAG: sugar phosphate isomerase/epimerase [Ruminococcaceae bacterium]|nr:sugar phosphate isomerase/epimerase [Oscillospiraceae bacterium]